MASLTFFLLTHALGMLSMAALLRGGMDSMSFGTVERMHYVAQHSLEWRIGWLPWQLAALSNLAVCASLLAWLRGRGPRGLAFLAAALFVVAAVPEQYTEYQMVTSLVDAAQAHEPMDFGLGWGIGVVVTAVWAALFYTAMTAAWMFSLRRAGHPVWPLPAELGLLGVFVVGAVVSYPVASLEGAPWDLIAAITNGPAFLALTVWSASAIRVLLREPRPG